VSEGEEKIVMKIRPYWIRTWALMLALVFTIGMIGLPGAQGGAWAQSTPTHSSKDVKHKKNFAQRHPTLTSAAAGYTAYKIAKKTGKNRAAVGKKKNFAQRHPMLTGVAVAGATHHVIKKSEKKR
jgi:hypothetical protein